jgi:lipoate-protein ligase B
MSPLNFAQQRLEANFRHHLMRVREYSEAIALDKGAGFEDKIAAIGIRVRRWVTFHGISLIVDSWRNSVNLKEQKSFHVCCHMVCTLMPFPQSCRAR